VEGHRPQDGGTREALRLRHEQTSRGLEEKASRWTQADRPREPIKQIGEYPVKISLPRDAADITVKVIEEQGEAQGRRSKKSDTAALAFCGSGL
jgi:hypothetical protein